MGTGRGVLLYPAVIKFSACLGVNIFENLPHTHPHPVFTVVLTVLTLQTEHDFTHISHLSQPRSTRLVTTIPIWPPYFRASSVSLSLFHSIQSYNSPFPLTTAAFLIAGLDTLYKYLITFHTVESYQQAGHVLTISIFSPSLQKQDFYTLLFISVSFFLSKKSKKAKSTCFGRVFHHWLSFLWCLQQSWTLHPL